MGEKNHVADYEECPKCKSRCYVRKTMCASHQFVRIADCSNEVCGHSFVQIEIKPPVGCTDNNLLAISDFKCCPKCGCGTEVTQSAETGNERFRNRVCFNPKCRHSFLTREIVPYRCPKCRSRLKVHGSVLSYETHVKRRRICSYSQCDYRVTSREVDIEHFHI